MVLNKYAAALLSIAIAIFTALAAIPVGQRTPESLWQVALIGIGAVVTWWVPLVGIKWAGMLKTGAAVLAAVIGALIPLLITGTLTGSQWLVLGLAGLNALAVEVGVGIRRDTEEIQVGNG